MDALDRPAVDLPPGTLEREIFHLEDVLLWTQPVAVVTNFAVLNTVLHIVEVTWFFVWEADLSHRSSGVSQDWKNRNAWWACWFTWIDESAFPNMTLHHLCQYFETKEARQIELNDSEQWFSRFFNKNIFCGFLAKSNIAEGQQHYLPALSILQSLIGQPFGYNGEEPHRQSVISEFAVLQFSCISTSTKDICHR